MTEIEQFFQQPGNLWIFAAGLIFVTWALLFWGRHWLLQRCKASHNRWGRVAGSLLEKTQPLFLLVLSLYIASSLLPITWPGVTFLKNILLVLILIQVGLWGNQFIVLFLDHYAATHELIGPTSLGIVNVALKGVLWLLLSLFLLNNFGFDITALVTGLGIGGIAIALAVQSVLQDLFASLGIVVDKPFLVGDMIAVGEFTGTVEYIGIKTTRIRSLSGEQLIFSNSDLLKSRLRNFKRMTERRVEFSITVVPNLKHEVIVAIPGMIKAIIQEDPLARFDRAHLKAIVPSGLEFLIVYFVLDPSTRTHMDVQERINQKLLKTFEEKGIAFYSGSVEVTLPEKLNICLLK